MAANSNKPITCLQGKDGFHYLLPDGIAVAVVTNAVVSGADIAAFHRDLHDSEAAHNPAAAVPVVFADTVAVPVAFAAALAVDHLLSVR